MNLECTKRDGSVKIKQLRRDGFVPGVVYGKNLDENVSIAIKMKTLISLKNTISIGSQVTLLVDGVEYSTMIKTFDRTVMDKSYQHFDFQVLTEGEKIKTSVSINFINKDEIKEEGNVQEYLHAVEYEVLPKDILDSIEVDLSVLTYSNDITVADLAISSDERYHVITASNTTVATLAPIVEVVLETEDTDQVVTEEVEEETEEATE